VKPKSVRFYNSLPEILELFHISDFRNYCRALTIYEAGCVRVEMVLREKKKDGVGKNYC